MPEKITACVTCGSTRFFIAEVQTFSAEVDQATGTLEASGIVHSDIEALTCEQCEQSYSSSSFEHIEFC
jgi:hypothetical protein